jgi:hypothetical protein
MAYMNQEKKARIASLLKPILAKYGVKGTLAVRNHSTIVLNIKSGAIDFIQNYLTTDRTSLQYAMSEEQYNHVYEKRYLDVNPYHYQNHFSGTAKQFLNEVMAAMNAGNHDNSDIQTDYFDVGWYVDVNIGQWNKPYEVK